MGATKYEVYTRQQIEFAKLFKAFGHPARMAVIENLMKASGKEGGLKELFEGIKLAQSTKSRHLKQLVDVGIVKTKVVTKEKKSCLRYRINQPAIELIQQVLDFIYENHDWKSNDKRISGDSGFYTHFRTNIDWQIYFQT